MNSVDLIRPQLDKLQRIALPVGIVGLLLTAAGFFLPLLSGNNQGVKMFLTSYLVAYMLVLGVTLGSMAWLLIHHVAGGGAFFLIRRLLEAGAKNLPLMAVLFLPLLVGLLPSNGFYEWANPGLVAQDKILSLKVAYLNVPFWLARTVFYFVVWGTIVFLMMKWSRQQHEGNERASHNLSMWSALGLVLYVFTMTFAAFDWVMSLTPHWFSSLFGVIFIVGQGLSTLCLMHVLINHLTKGTNLTDWVPQRYFRDLGNLTLAFTLLWAYMNFSQYVIIWSGNLGEEAEWYVPRIQTNWVIVGGFLIAAHFALPFLSLLSSSLKVRIQNLAKLALWILLMRWVDMNFYITATFAPDLFGNRFMGNGNEVAHLNAVNWLALIGGSLGLPGIWLSLWARNLKAAPELITTTDPRFVGQFEVPPSPDARPSAAGAHGHGAHAGATAHG
jgi:hypothetical protein